MSLAPGPAMAQLLLRSNVRGGGPAGVNDATPLRTAGGESFGTTLTHSAAKLQIVPKSTPPVRTRSTNSVQAAGLKVRAGPLGFFESRTPMPPRTASASANSTQLLPVPSL